MRIASRLPRKTHYRMTMRPAVSRSSQWQCKSHLARSMADGFEDAGVDCQSCRWCGLCKDAGFCASAQVRPKASLHLTEGPGSGRGRGRCQGDTESFKLAEPPRFGLSLQDQGGQVAVKAGTADVEPGCLLPVFGKKASSQKDDEQLRSAVLAEVGSDRQGCRCRL